MKITDKGTLKPETKYSLRFVRKESPKNGFAFSCDENGVVDVNTLTDKARTNYEKCQRDNSILCKGVESSTKMIYESHPIGQCECGESITLRLSINRCECGKIYDARGCEIRIRKHY